MPKFLYSYPDSRDFRSDVHPCYANFGNRGDFDKFYFCPASHNIPREDFQLLVDKLRESCLTKEGGEFEIVTAEELKSRGNVYVEEEPLWIQVTFPMDLPAWRVFRLCKLAGKAFGYGNGGVNEMFIKYLKDGRTFEEACCLISFHIDFGYHYPRIQASSKEQVVKFLKSPVLYTEPKSNYGTTSGQWIGHASFSSVAQDLFFEEKYSTTYEGIRKLYNPNLDMSLSISIDKSKDNWEIFKKEVGYE